MGVLIDVFAHKRAERHRHLVATAQQACAREAERRAPHAAHYFWEEIRDRLHAAGCTRVHCNCVTAGVVGVVALPLLPRDRLTTEETQQALAEAARLLGLAGYRVRKMLQADLPHVLVAAPFSQGTLFD